MMTAEIKPRKSLARRIGRAGIVAVVLVVALFAAAPYLLSTQFFSGWVLKRIFADVHGTVSAERLDFGWFSPPRISGFEIRSLDDQPVVSVGSIEAEQPLWQLVSHPAEIGHVTVDAPHAYLIVTKDGTNFAATFPRDPNRKVPARWRQEAMRVGVDRGEFTWQLAGSEHRWSLGGLQLGVELLPAWLADAHEARLVIEPETVVNHAELSTGMCEDVLKFIAPVLSNATTTNGNFSLALAGGSIPVDHLRDTQLQGVLTLHAVNIGPGAWLAKLATFIKLPSEVSIARESAVKFHVAKARVHHSGLEFGSDEFHVRTSGSVGFDESLDLVAEVQLQLSDSTAARLPVLRALNNRTLRLPIKGTFKHPEFDWGGRTDLKQGLLAAFQGTIAPDAAAQLPNQLQAGGLLANPAAVSSAAVDLGIAAGDLVKELVERRRERKQEQAEAQQQANQPPMPENNPDKAPAAANTGAAPPAGTSAPAKRGVLGQVLRAVVEAAAEAAQPDEPPGTTPAAPPTSVPAPPAPAPPRPAPVAPVPPPNPDSAAAPPAADPSGPRLLQPANGVQSPSAQAPAASRDSSVGTTNGSRASRLTPAAAPPVPAAVPPVAASAAPPPPLLSTPLPAAPFQPSPTKPAAKTPKTEEEPRRPLGRALRALVQAAADAAAQSDQPQSIGPAPPAGIPAAPGAPAAGSPNPSLPQTPGAPPTVGAPPANPDNPRRPALRRLFRAAIEAAAEAASQPPATQPAPAAPQPQPAAPPAESLPAPAPAPAPAPE